MLDKVSSRTSLYLCLLTLIFAAASALASIPAAWGGFVLAEFAAGGLVLVLWRRGDVTVRTVIALAILFRFLFLWLPPVLSDDAFRYVWDGLVQAHGINPFAHRPADAELAFLQSEPVYAHLNSSTYYTVYPPLSQVLFHIGALFYDEGWPVAYYAIKALLAGCELGALWLLSRRVEPRFLMLYAWNPLVILAAAGQAHTEAAVVLFLVAAWMLAQRSHGGLAAVALAAAGLIKLYPFILLPLLWRRFGWRSVWPAGLTIAVVSWPYVHPDAVANMLASLDLYVRFFEFNAGPYYGVKKIFAIVTGEDWSKQIGPALRWLFLGSLPAIFYLDARLSWPIRRSMIAVLGVFFVCSTTVHPWYLLPLLALVAPAQPPSWHWLWLGLASVGTYLLYVDGPYWGWVIIGWTGWTVLIAVRYFRSGVDRLLRARARWKADLVMEFTPNQFGDCTLLDLGAAEGYVGLEIADRTGVRVTLADVQDRNRTALPYVVYDGRVLPFDDDTFDAIVLVYVLHHAESAETLLSEAARVSGGPIIIVESVYTNRLQCFVLSTADRIANFVRSSGEMTRLSDDLDFRTFDEWVDTLEKAKFSIDAVRDLGGIIHHRALFVVSRT